MTKWHWLIRHWSWNSSGRPGSCPHCGCPLLVCPACRGAYDSGRLCQQCTSGTICPTCQRHWTWN
jgi:hypothetical protein